MSRSGYSDGLESGELNMWRGAVHRATIGKRGQAFFRELVAALDEMPVMHKVLGERHPFWALREQWVAAGKHIDADGFAVFSTPPETPGDPQEKGTR